MPCWYKLRCGFTTYVLALQHILLFCSLSLCSSAAPSHHNRLP